MRVLVPIAVLIQLATALPRSHWVADNTAGDVNAFCDDRYNQKPKASEGYTYYNVIPVSPRVQWDDAGGYCGSMSVQNAAMGKGVWLSQQQVDWGCSSSSHLNFKVRNHTDAGGGHDEEILATNIGMMQA